VKNSAQWSQFNIRTGYFQERFPQSLRADTLVRQLRFLVSANARGLTVK